MTSGAADPSSSLSYVTTKWVLASPKEPEVLKAPAPTGDPGSCPPTRVPQNRAISAPGYVRAVGGEEPKHNNESSLCGRLISVWAWRLH
jgi:hypothetical protein